MSTALAPAAQPSAVAAFVALVGFSFRQQWRVRGIGWVALGLLAVLTIVVAVTTHGKLGWGLKNRVAWRYWTSTKDSPFKEGTDEKERVKDTVEVVRYKDAMKSYEMVQMVPQSSNAAGMEMIAFATLRVILMDEVFLDEWAFLNFSRWVVFGLYLGFLMPLFTLAFASGAIGSEREGRTLIWLFTRPMPKWAIYLAKYLGMLPWCFLATGGGFVALCLAGGEYGLRAMAVYWPAVLAGTVGFSALFHFIGAVFRRPTVVGLVYIFFFELLVANLPGSLKQLSLNYYVRSLLYNEAASVLTRVSPESLAVYDPADSTTAWATLGLATIGITGLGMWLFGRLENRDET